MEREGVGLGEGQNIPLQKINRICFFTNYHGIIPWFFFSSFNNYIVHFLESLLDLFKTSQLH